MVWNPATGEAVDKLVAQLEESGIEYLLDDRDISAGIKLKDSDLIGFPYRILLSSKTLEKSSAEFKVRSEPEVSLIPLDKVVSTLKNHLDS